MTRFILRRLFTALVTLLISTFLVCMLIHLIPGDPVVMMMAQNSSPTPEQLAAMRHMLGLDLPLWLQYFHYMGRLLHGDLGRSIFGSDPVLRVLLERLPNTFALAFAGLVIAVGLGLPLGFFAAYHKGSWADSALMLFAVAGVSVPNFWLGLMLVLLFSTTLDWLPVAGEDWNSMILPALTLGVTYMAIIARMTRSAMIEVFGEDFIRTARAKGLPEALVMYRHALKPAMIGVVTIIGVVFGYLMGGSVVVENVFSWNGLGRLAIQAINYRDYPLIQGFILLFATIVVIVSVLLDRLRMARSEDLGLMTVPAAPASLLPVAAQSVARVRGRRIRGILRSRSIVIGGTVILIVAILAVCAPYIAPFTPEQIGAGRRLSPPGAAHWLGTDEFGRDILSRILFGARLTLYIGMVAVGIGFTCGVAIGAVAAYAGGWLGSLLMRTDGSGRSHGATAAAAPVSAPAVRRHAPARDDRDGAGVRARSPRWPTASP
jgi:peptide/nickel transport system permease protein